MTTTKTPEQEANELVEMFRPLVSGTDLETMKYIDALRQSSAIKCAIIHVERLIEVLEKLLKYSELRTCFYIVDEINDHQQVLQILKDNK